MPPHAPKSPFEFPAMLQSLADDVATAQARLRAQLHNDDCRGGDPTRCCIAAKGGTINTKALAELVTAAKSLGTEIRSWDGHVKSNLDKMTPARKAQVVMRFLQDLPLSGRRDIYAVLARLEAERPDGLGLQITDRFTGSTAVE